MQLKSPKRFCYLVFICKWPQLANRRDFTLFVYSKPQPQRNFVAANKEPHEKNPLIRPIGLVALVAQQLWL